MTKYGVSSEYPNGRHLMVIACQFTLEQATALMEQLAALPYYSKRGIKLSVFGVDT